MIAQYNTDYYAIIRSKYAEFAKEFVPVLYAYYKPSSVIDIGCGIGLYLAEFHRIGIKIKGIDASLDAQKNSAIDESFFELADLSKPIVATDQYDMCICSEVAEHLSPDAADILVRSLCDFSSLIIFSAAHPRQKGTGHVNEQPQEYWIKKFADHGYDLQRSQRDEIKRKILGFKTFHRYNCFHMNLLIFSKRRT